MRGMIANQDWRNTDRCAQHTNHRQDCMDCHSAIFDLDQEVHTVESGTGVAAGFVLMLSWDEIGSNPDVVMRDFCVFTQSINVWVDPTLSDQFSYFSKAWNVHTETGSPIDDSVADLAPRAVYSVRQNGKQLGVFT